MAAMKYSGAKWIGDIPEEWCITRLKDQLKINNGKEIDNDEGKIPVYGSGGAFKWTDKVLCNEPALLLGRKGTVDKPLLVKEPFWTVDTMFYSTLKNEACLDYLYFCSTCFDYKHFQTGSTLPSMTQTDLGSILLPWPCVNEQHVIAAYLNRKCMIADKAIMTLESQISTLERYRSSVIHEAVTRGLDSTVPTKSSGIAWIGDIPESWKVYRLKFFAVSDLGLMLDEKQMTNVNVHEYLANKDVQWFSVNETGLSEASFPLGSEQRYQIMDGDILICEGGEVGRCAVWHGPSPRFYYQKAIHRLRVDKSIANPDFIAYQFFDKAKTTNFVEVRKGVSTIAHLPGDQLMRLKFTVPPLEEQNAIADYLDARTTAIDAVLDTKRKQVDILRRRRQSLIYEYVTGKRRVTEEA